MLLATSTLLCAQDIEFGEVNKEELQDKFSPIDSSATAEYLYKYRQTYFEYISGEGFRLVTNIHERIKIYNKSGFDYATKKVLLYKDGNTKERISKLKAKTYNLVDQKIIETSLGRDGQFEEEVSENLEQFKFTMPNIKEGSILEYKYYVTSPFISSIDEFVFQHEIPVRKLEAIFDAPEYFVFRLNVKGFLSIPSPKKERINRTLNYAQRVASGGGNGTGAGLGLGRTKLETSKINFFSEVSTYNLTNLPPLKDEPFTTNLSNYTAGVKYELSYTEFPNAPKDFYSTTWEDVVKSIYKNPRFGQELDKKGYFKKDLANLVTGITDPNEITLKIFNFVKSKINWNNQYGKYTQEGVKDAYQNGVGNVADINLVLTAMLSEAGLESNPVLVSTRSNGIPLFPTRDGYNYVVSSVKLNDEILLLDASSKYSAIGILPFRALNWEGRIIDSDGVSNVTGLYPAKRSTTRNYLNGTIDMDGTVNGKIRTAYTNHQALGFRDSYNPNDKNSFIANIDEKSSDMITENFDIVNIDTAEKSPIVTYDFHVEDELVVVGEQLFFSPLLFLADKNSPFKLESREFPIDFGFPFENTNTITLITPEGYKVDFLPESMSLAMPDNLGNFKYSILSTDEGIQVRVSNSINTAVIPPAYYPIIKEYYEKMITKMNEKVVLIKV